MNIKLFLALVLAFSASATAQDDPNEPREYKGDKSQLESKGTVDTSVAGKLNMHIILPYTFAKNQRLTRDLKRVWRKSVVEFCHGSFKGQPELSIAYIGESRCFDIESHYAYTCPDPINGISGEFTCSVGM